MSMTDKQAAYFAPKDVLSMREKVIAGLRHFPPLEPGTMISYDDISEWLGEPFPRRTGEGERSYDPMDSVKDDLLNRGILILNREGTGYQVATASEMIEHGERSGYLAAVARNEYGTRVIRAADLSRVPPQQAVLARFLIQEMQQSSRVMRERLRAQHREASKWDAS